MNNGWLVVLRENNESEWQPYPFLYKTKKEAREKVRRMTRASAHDWDYGKWESVASTNKEGKA
jgi:DNA-binding transcriptional regulator PaaX